MRDLLLGYPSNDRGASVIPAALQLGDQPGTRVQAPRLLHARDHRQPRGQRRRGGLGALPQDVVRGYVPVPHAHLPETLQAPAQVPGLVVRDSSEIGEKLRRDAASRAGVVRRREPREPGHGVPREVDRVELDVRHVVNHRGGHAQLARLGRRDEFGLDELRQRGPGRHGGWGRETHAHGAARVDELGVGGVAQRGFHRGVRGAKHEVRALREGRRQRRRRLVGGPRGWEVGLGIILAARVRLLRVPLAPHPPSVQRRPPPLSQPRPHPVRRRHERVHRLRGRP